MNGAAQRGTSADKASDLPEQLARIKVLNTSELRSLVLSTTGKPPSRQLSGDVLRRMLSYRIQTKALGGLDPKTTKLLDRLADGGGEGNRRLMHGSVLTRELNGTMHQVMVVAEGFTWQDRTYPSLSAVAKAMTGTTWNGHRFFGLKASSGLHVDVMASKRQDRRRHARSDGRSDPRP